MTGLLTHPCRTEIGNYTNHQGREKAETPHFLFAEMRGLRSLLDSRCPFAAAASAA